jgi:PKD repeat protein
MRKNYVLIGSLVVAVLVAAALLFWLWDRGQKAPTASFVLTPGAGEAPLEVKLDGSESSDPAGAIADFAWDFGDGQTAAGPVTTHKYGDAGTFTVKLTVTNKKGATSSITKSIIVTEGKAVAHAPLFTEIEPADGAVVQGKEAWIRWHASTPAKGKVLWRKAGEADFRTVDALDGDPLLARLTELKPGEKYEYIVEQSGEGTTQRSSQRTFTAEAGLALEPAAQEQTVQRDYNQTVKVTLHNTSDKKVMVAAKALAQFEDLAADIVGRGSVDEPVELAAGEKLDLRLAVTATDATRETYDIPIEAGGASTVVHVRVAQAKLQLSFQVVKENPYTLAKTIEIRNDGSTLADLGVRVAPPHHVDVRVDPATGHAYLASGKTLQIVATPILYLEFQSLKTELECRSGAQIVRFPLEFKAPAGKRLIGVRTNSGETTGGQDWSCPNKPDTCSTVPGPGGNGPAPPGPAGMGRALLDERLIAYLLLGAPPAAAPTATPASQQKHRSCEDTKKCTDPYIQHAKELWDLLKGWDDLIRDLEHPSAWQTLWWGTGDWMRNQEKIASAKKMRQTVLDDYNQNRAKCLADCGFDVGDYRSADDPGVRTGPNEPRPCPPARSPADSKKQQKDVAGQQAQTFNQLADYWKDRPDAFGHERVFRDAAKDWERRAADPPSPDFREVVQPRVEPISPREGTTEIERLVASLADACRWRHGYLNAHLASYERYQGAEAAKDKHGMLRQAEAMRHFATSSLEASRRVQRCELACERWELRELQPMLEAGAEKGIDWEEAAAAWRKRLEASGTPADVRDALVAGASADVATEIASDKKKIQALTPSQCKSLLASSQERLRRIDELLTDGTLRKRIDLWAEPMDLSALISMQLHAEELRASARAAPDPADPERREGPMADVPPMRPGLLEALQRRVSFTRAHRGAFAAILEGDATDSSDTAAGWHAGDRVCFAWHQQDQIAFTSFEPLGGVVMEPQVIGKGRWPRLTTDGKRTAVAWSRDDGSVVRVHDGKQWGDEVALTGREAAIAFAPDGLLFAATSTGLWKLNGKTFERVQDTAYAQPALAMDDKGQPRVAWRRDGRIMFGDKAVDEGERPTLAVSADGTTHLAYLSKDSIIVRSRKGEEWTPANTISAKNPAWPTLAQSEEGPRLSYLGAAETGPDALWLVRLPEKEPALMPSLAGNVTEAALVVNFTLRDARWKYRPYDLWLSVNDAVVRTFSTTVPEGRYLVKLTPHQVFTSSGRPAPNRIGIHSWHMNAGHYVTVGDFRLMVHTAWNEQYAFGASEEEVRRSAETPRINHDRPDLTVLANGMELPMDAPKTGNIDFPVTVANLGEASSKTARLVMLDDKKPLVQTNVPALKPGEQWSVTMRLNGRLEKVTFRVEQEQPDFDPTNDALTVHLWTPEEAALVKNAAGTVVAAGNASELGTPGKFPVDILDDPEPPHLCRVLDAQKDTEVARIEGGKLQKPLPTGKYRIALIHYQFEGEEVLFPQVIEYEEGKKLHLEIKSALRITKPKSAGPLFRWEVVKADKPNEVVQWQYAAHPLMLVPPGEYLVAVKPTQYNSERLVWPAKVTVKDGEPTVVKLESAITLDMPEAVGPLYRWEVVETGKPERVVQWHLADVRSMLVPPGEYLVTVKPTQYNSERLVWPAKFTVKEGEPTVVKLGSSIKIEVPNSVGPLHSWEIVRPDKPDQAIQRHLGDVRYTLAPPGEYLLAIKPTQYDSERLVWPAKVAVKDGEPTIVKLGSSIKLDMPENAGPLFRWEIVRPDKPDRVVQTHRGDIRSMLAPPGEYLVVVKPTQYNSERFVWPAKLTVKEGEQTTAKLGSSIRLDVPKEAGAIERWEIVAADKPDRVLQALLGDVRATVLAPGEYQVAIQPTKFTSERLLWPERITIKEGEQAVARMASGIRIVGPKQAQPEFEFQVISVETKKVVQRGQQTWAAQLLPPGAYRVEVRADSSATWQTLTDKAIVEAGQFAEVKMQELPKRK